MTYMSRSLPAVYIFASICFRGLKAVFECFRKKFAVIVLNVLRVHFLTCGMFCSSVDFDFSFKETR